MEGATSVSEAAHRILGAQAQVEVWGQYALAMRTAVSSLASEVAAEAVDPPSIVRTWGQRDTLHLYALEDWPLFTAFRRHWARGGRVGGDPPEELLEQAGERFQDRGIALSRSDLFDLLPKSYLESVRNHRGAGGTDHGARRFAASRVVERLAHRGVIAFWGRSGSELTYLHRDRIWSGEWPEMDPLEVALEVLRRYFAAFAPATEYDAAHYLGVKITLVREWLKKLHRELAVCEHPSFGKQYALSADLETFRNVPETWPLRLLAAYDTLLMGHKNKRWILPDPSFEKEVWAKLAVVRSTILQRGQIVGVWSVGPPGADGRALFAETFPAFESSSLDALRNELERFASRSAFKPSEIDVRSFGT